MKKKVKKDIPIRPFESLKTKIILLTVLATLPTLALGVVLQLYNNRFISEYSKINEKLLLIEKVKDQCENILPIVREYVTNPYEAQNINKFEAIEANTEKLLLNLANSEQHGLNEEYGAFFADVSVYMGFCKDIFNLGVKLNTKAKGNYIKVPYLLEIVKKSSLEYTMSELKVTNELQKENNEKIWTIYTVSFISVIIFVGIILIMLLSVLRKIIFGISNLVNLSYKISKGEYELSELKVKDNDEIGILTSAFNDMIIGLKNAHEEIDLHQAEQETLNKELLVANKQLMTANEEIRNAQEQVIQSEKLASLGGLVAGVSHEVNTPIGVSITAASFLKDKNKELIESVKSGKLTKNEFEKYSKNIEETTMILLTNLDRAAELIQSFKMIAVDQTSEEIRLINLKEYIEDVILSLKHILKKTSLKILITSQDEDLCIETYAGTLAQLMTNLIMNSILHGYDEPKKGEIHIDIFRETKNICLIFQDDGRGIEKNILKRIFEPFFTTKRGTGGSGLGLYIVYNIVTNYLKGAIDCESEIGKGAKFIIKIPTKLQEKQ